jgi:Polyketide cyclase / dehydrase and lipid transport
VRYLAVRLLLILAVPPAFVAVTSPLELSKATRQNLFLGLGAAGFLLTLAVIAPFAIRSERHRKQAGRFDEHIQLQDDRYSTMFVAGVLDSLALIVDGSSTPLGLVISGFCIVWTMAWLPGWMRRLGIRTAIVIQRDQATVFAFVADQRNGPRYIPEIESVEKVTDGAIGQGTRFHTRMRLPNGTVEGLEEIVDYQAPNEITTRVVDALRPNIEVLNFESVPEGTRLHHRFDSEITYSAALLNQGLMRPLIWLDMRSRRMEAWRRLKQVLESPAAT